MAEPKVTNNTQMAEPEVIDREPTDNDIKIIDGYSTKSTIFKKPYLYKEQITENNIDYSQIARDVAEYKPFLKIPKLPNNPNITIHTVNNVIKGIVLVLATSSLFVPISYIGGGKTKKNKAKK